MAKQIIPPEEAQRRLGEISNTTFYEKIIGKGRLRLIRVTERRVGVLEDELDALIDEMAATSDQKETASA